MKKLVAGAVVMALTSVALITSSASAVSSQEAQNQISTVSCEESLFEFDSPPEFYEFAGVTWRLVGYAESGYWLYRDAACY